MSKKAYKVVCNVCGGSSGIKITDMDQIEWVNTDKVISGRKRLDQQWGWQCYCGNNDLETDQERKYIKDLTSPEPQEITDIVNNLKVQKPKFVMEEL